MSSIRNADLIHLGTCCCCGNDDAYYPVCVDCVPQADCDHGDAARGQR